ncbi:hypothetical protein APHAL10511_004382 [Amanita phalloides]|nr:hypothetical protein APHAL10511_004382 [Amanita phalloides]
MPPAPVSFPAELVEEIIKSAWSLPLCADDRIILMTSLSMVHSIWRQAYIQVSSRDVYIPCVSYHDRFLGILRRECKFYDKDTQACMESKCRSITFNIEHPPVPQVGPTIDYPAAKAMADLLYFLSDDQFPSVPNLRKIAIYYHNMNFADIFENLRLSDFPSQVVELEIFHTFSPQVPKFLVLALRNKDESHLHLFWRMPHIRHLTLVGVGCDYVANMVAVCPNLETLELWLPPDSWLHVYIPYSFRRILLHVPKDADLSENRLSCPHKYTLPLPAVHNQRRWLFIKNKDERQLCELG